MDKIIIYCDGGCRGNGREDNVGGWGVYLTKEVKKNFMVVQKVQPIILWSLLLAYKP